MERILLDQGWEFRKGFLDMVETLEDGNGVLVNLPHDAMIGGAVTSDAPGRFDMGYFKGSIVNYTKKIDIPKEWEGDCVFLCFDGAMSNASIDINGYKVTSQHYGYAPFYADLTDYVTFGQLNRITVNLNTSMQENSRWYTGTGLYRSVELCYGPKVHVAESGIYVYTKEIGDVSFDGESDRAEYALIEAEATIENASDKNRLVQVVLEMKQEGSSDVIKKACSTVYVSKGSSEIASFSFTIDNPKLWDADNPNLYEVTVRVQNFGEYRTHLIPEEDERIDESRTLFGIRMLSVDAKRGLRINGKSIKLKGGCLHHDNGLLGAVSLYEAEVRKIRKLKELGYNAVRTAHNPPSAALLEACARLGMYVFDEAFDAWNMAKRSGDYSQYFATDWNKDLTSFVKRDRNNPAVIIWSTGNEIPERGGLGGGYKTASMLAREFRKLDTTRPVSNALCSMWSGLDDELARCQDHQQNASAKGEDLLWEKVTEPFANGLDIVGYNYLEDLYEKDHDMFPDRVMLGTETFPKEIGFRWPFVEEHSYVIGDFTWTAWDYLGEAGIGKTVYVDNDDPLVKRGPWAVMPYETSPYPWRCANDADFDITGRLLPQGEYRSIAWHSDKTFVYSKHPDTFGKVEICGMWGFPYVEKSWNYKGYEGKNIEIVVFSGADEVEVLVNGKSIGTKRTDLDKRFPNAASFETIYENGIVEAISYKDGKEIGRDKISTTKAPSGIRLVPEKNDLRADGHDLSYVGIEVVDDEGNVVPDSNAVITVEVTGPAILAGLGSGNPFTEENYTDSIAETYKGRAMAVIRSGYEEGGVVLTVRAEIRGLERMETSLSLTVKSN